MATGDKLVNIINKRILGAQSFKDNLIDFLRGDVHHVLDKVYRTSGTFEQLTLASGGADAFTIGGYTADFVSAMDGDGYFLRPTDASSYITAVPFENAVGNDYHVAIRQADIPDGLFVNPRDGVPMFDTMKEVIGWSGTPNSVQDNGDGTLTFVVNSVTESGVSHADRKIKVWKNTPGIDAQTEALAVEECDVVWDASNNKITTVANFGQGSNPSTTAADYTVVLMGPRVSRSVDLKNLDPWCFIGVITGNGPGIAPVGFDLTEQKTIDIPLSDLSDIVRYEGASGTDRLKIDVTVYGGDESEDQIRVTQPGAAEPIVFRVDGDGNVTIEGDLEVKGTTTQRDITQVNTHDAYFDNLTLGNDTGDAHLIKGLWEHKNIAESTTFFRVDETDGHVSINAAYDATSQLFVNGAVRIVNGALTCQDVLPASGSVDIGAVANKWRAIYAQNIYADATSVGGNMNPDTDNAYDLGETTTPLRWQDIHLSGSASVTEAGDETNILFNAGQAYTYFNAKDAQLRFSNPGAGTNEKNWRMVVDDVGGQEHLYWSTLDDSWANPHTFFQVKRVADDMDVEEIMLWADTRVYINSQLEVSGNILPTSTNDIGASGTPWSDAYITTLHLGTVDGEGVATDLKPTTSGSFGLGSLTRYWNTGHISTVNVTYLNLAAGPGQGVAYDLNPQNDGTQNMGSIARWGTINCNGLDLSDTGGQGCATNIVPDTDDSLDLGNSSYQWRDLYIDGTAYIDTADIDALDVTDVISHLFPDADDTRDLGSSSYQWRNLYIDGTAYIDTLSLSGVAGEGVATSINPTVGGSYSLGDSTYYWSSIYGINHIAYYSTPGFKWYETDAATGNRGWGMVADGERLSFRAWNDTFASGSIYWCEIFGVERTGYGTGAVDYIEFNTSILFTAANSFQVADNINYCDEMYSACFIAKGASIPAGASGSYIGYTGTYYAGNTGTTGIVKKDTASTATNSGWILLWVDGGAMYFPVWPDK